MSRVRVDGIDVHYESAGDGARILCLIHGTGGTGGAWTDQLEGLRDVARVITPDLPGHGQSGGERPVRIEDFAAFVAHFLDALSVGRVVIGGHSMGGAIAQQFALTWPERVDGLILVGTGARLRVLPRLLDLLARDYEEGIRLLMQLGVGPKAPAELRARLHRLTAANRPGVVLGDLQACDVFDVMSRVGDIGAPTLAICGEDDQLTPPRYSQFFAERIARARRVVVPGAGHYVQVEQPGPTNAAVRELLSARIAG